MHGFQIRAIGFQIRAIGKSNPSDNVLFKVYGKNGKLIEKASYKTDEFEVLFKSGTEFVVEKVFKDTSPINDFEKITYIILKEK